LIDLIVFQDNYLNLIPLDNFDISSTFSSLVRCNVCKY